MDFTAALQIATQVISTFTQIEPVAVQAIEDFKPFADALIQKLMGTPLTADQRTALETQIDSLSAQFQAPIPPDDQQ